MTTFQGAKRPVAGAPVVPQYASEKLTKAADYIHDSFIWGTGSIPPDILIRGGAYPISPSTFWSAVEIKLRELAVEARASGY